MYIQVLILFSYKKTVSEGIAWLIIRQRQIRL